MWVQFTNAAFPPQVYEFSSALLHPNDVQEHQMDNKLRTVMFMSDIMDQMIGRSDDQKMECGGGELSNCLIISLSDRSGGVPRLIPSPREASVRAQAGRVLHCSPTCRGRRSRGCGVCSFVAASSLHAPAWPRLRGAAAAPPHAERRITAISPDSPQCIPQCARIHHHGAGLPVRSSRVAKWCRPIGPMRC